MAKETPLCYKHTSQGLASSAISYFLDDRIAELTSQQVTLMAYKEGLFESKTLISNEDFQAELQAVVEAIALRTRDLRILSRQRRLVEQYLETDTQRAHGVKNRRWNFSKWSIRVRSFRAW